MKKILIGALIASSLAMGGDLEKCSHALERADQFDKLAEVEHKKLLALWEGEASTTEALEKKVYKKNAEFVKKQETLYRAVKYKWEVQATKECK